MQEVQEKWEEWKEAKQVQEAKLKEEEAIDMWMEAFLDEQRTDQTQWTHLPHLPHEQAAVRVLDHHSHSGHCPA